MTHARLVFALALVIAAAVPAWSVREEFDGKSSAVEQLQVASHSMQGEASTGQRGNDTGLGVRLMKHKVKPGPALKLQSTKQKRIASEIRAGPGADELAKCQLGSGGPSANGNNYVCCCTGSINNCRYYSNGGEDGLCAIRHKSDDGSDLGCCWRKEYSYFAQCHGALDSLVGTANMQEYQDDYCNPGQNKLQLRWASDDNLQVHSAVAVCKKCYTWMAQSGWDLGSAGTTQALSRYRTLADLVNGPWSRNGDSPDCHLCCRSHKGCDCTSMWARFASMDYPPMLMSGQQGPCNFISVADRY